MARRRDLERIGWREWVALPDLGIGAIKAKIDTGARSSALHAFDIRKVPTADGTIVRFRVHPVQRDPVRTADASAPLVDERWITSSGGHRTLRPVIRTSVTWLGLTWPIELTLVGRDEMGFRLLLGRQAVRNRFLVDPGRSYHGGRPDRPDRPGRKPGPKSGAPVAESPKRRKAGP